MITVGDYIELLKKFDPKLPILIHDSDWETYRADDFPTEAFVRKVAPDEYVDLLLKDNQPIPAGAFKAVLVN